MQSSGLIKLLMASVAVTACVSGRSGTGTNTGVGTGTTSSTATASTTTGSTTMTSGGDVDMNGGGLWSDGTSSGMWMDTTGSMRMGGRRGRMMGLEAANISSMNNQNIVAHVATGDSLEIALSQLGAARAQSSAVRDFAQRMVTEHSTHLQMGRQLAQQNGIAPVPAPGDTMDVMMASRMMTRLTNGESASPSATSSTGGATDNASAAGDRQLIMAEVAMHRHMLHELTMLQPQASGPVRHLVDETIPIVRQHLTDAQALWRQVGGGNRRGSDGK